MSFDDFDRVFAARASRERYQPPRKSNPGAIRAWQALVHPDLRAAAVLRLVRLSADEIGAEALASAAVAPALVEIAADLTRHRSLGRRLAQAISPDDLGRLVLLEFARNRDAVSDDRPTPKGSMSSSGRNHLLLTWWTVLSADFAREYGIDLTGRDLDRLSWSTFLDRIAGLSAASRWAGAMSREAERDVVVLEGDAAEAYFATWGA